MAGKLQKSSNFFVTTEPSPGDINDRLRSGAFATPSWTWANPDTWQDPLSGKFIMIVSGNMVLQGLPNRRYRVTLSGVKQYVRGHRFVYKLDAFDTSSGMDYLFTIVTPQFRHGIDQYGTSAELTIEGRIPVQNVDPDDIVWFRRGAGEWRD